MLQADIDLTGQRFGKLVVLKRYRRVGYVQHWTCKCDCGLITEVPRHNNLMSGMAKACGHCREGKRQPVTHGHSTKGYSRTYTSWCSMKRRCKSTKRANADHYALAGVSYDASWEDFSAFLADMGERPDGMTLDRKDGAKGYSKENCRWATPTTQTRNRSIAKTHTQDGCTMYIAEWATEAGLSYSAAYKRIRVKGRV